MIYIPTKGRAGTSKTIAKLREEGIDEFVIFVEPQDQLAYLQAYPGIRAVVLEGNDRGLCFSRQSILAWARAQGLKSFWMLDDDISKMYFVENGKCVPQRFGDVLHRAAGMFENRGVAQGALEYQQFAWSAKKAVKWNSYCDVAVWFDVEKTRHVNYNAAQPLKQDRDITLQILSSGHYVCRAAWCAFAAPKNGSNAGGLQALYASQGREEAASREMERRWPGICQFAPKPDGRPDVKIHWRLFPPPPGA